MGIWDIHVYIDVLMFGTAPKESISWRWWFLEHTLVESSAEKWDDAEVTGAWGIYPTNPAW